MPFFRLSQKRPFIGRLEVFSANKFKKHTHIDALFWSLFRLRSLVIVNPNFFKA
jgi:hypothetical protein